VTKKGPRKPELDAMLFRLARGQARKIERHRLCGADRTLGIGAGQHVAGSMIAHRDLEKRRKPASLKEAGSRSDASSIPRRLIAAADAGARARFNQAAQFATKK